MFSTIRYEILEGLPTSGPMYISITVDGEASYAEGLAVRFYKTDGTSWVANFQPGGTTFKAVRALDNTTYLLIISYGLCFLIDPNETQPIATFGIHYQAILKDSNRRIVLQGAYDLLIIEPDGTCWRSEKISLDGLLHLTINDNIIYGKAYDPLSDQDDWVRFAYDLDNRSLTGGTFRRFKQ